MDNNSKRRNRKSGVFSPSQVQSPGLAMQGVEVQRRTSKRTSSKDRHGQVFTEASIRAVTPEAELDEAAPTMSPSESTAASPTTSRRGNGESTDTLVENLDRIALHSAGGRSRHGRGSRDNNVARPRTRTLEERRNQSPSSKNTRNRIGSLGAATNLDAAETGESTSSIGFPSIIPTLPSAAQTLQRQRLVRSPSRPSSPVLGVPTFATYSTDQANIEASPAIDTARILSLMKTTCGRMHGILSFRTSDSGNWTSGYCAINVATGSLIYQMKGNLAQTRTLIPDLRGCQVRTQGLRYSTDSYLEISNRSSGSSVHLRPHVAETFDSWLAALLCWQPLRPKGAHNKMPKPQPPSMSEKSLGDRRRNSGIAPLKDATIIKVGKMLYWDHNARVTTPQSPARRISTYKQQRSAAGTAWRKVSATLQENGQLKLYAEADNKVLGSISLSTLSRCAIQRLHPSVLEDEYCLAIYPQYTASSRSLEGKRVVHLSLETRVLFEVWFVLLRAFAVPELYGPEQSAVQSPVDFVDSAPTSPVVNTQSMFRTERLLSIRIVEAKLHEPRDMTENTASKSGPQSLHTIPGDYHAEVLLDGEVRGRTAVKHNTSNPFWREDYTFGDLPPVLSSAKVMLKSRNSGQRDWALIADESYENEETDISSLNHMDIVGEIQISPLDTILGLVDLNLNDLERNQDTERWWPIMNEREERIGDMLLKIRVDEAVVLMSHDYKPLSELLHRFSSGLTQQLVTKFSDLESRRIPDLLLNIFQVSGSATDWLISLVEDEIDGLHKEVNLSRFRYSQRLASNDSYDSSVDRELFMRDMNKNATAEANLLFRGNSLLTKALDAHMRRLGKDYLDEVLSEKIRDIDESDPDCEVDPGKVGYENHETLHRNWRNLIALTENIWKSISQSVNKCPPELRLIFRHIRSCAEDRYGDFKRSVSYSSVSGFLFLRFLCPAVLNPKLFGLLKDHPRPRSHRTLTLIAKSLQTLANSTTFGSKEPWMDPMNAFINTHRQEFKNFVDAICSIPADRATTNVPPSYTTPITILSRLPATSKEGFPSLPFLIDSAREFATLVSIWNDADEDAEVATNGSASTTVTIREETEMAAFDSACRAIRNKTRDALNRAEQAERPSGVLEMKWEELVTHMDRKSRAPRPKAQRYPSDPIYRNTSAQQRRMTADSTTTTGNNSVVSLDATISETGERHSQSRRSRPAPIYSYSHGGTPISETAASSPAEHTPPGSGSGVWSEEERFPPHAISWDQPDSATDQRIMTAEEEREARNRRTRRLGARSLSGSVRSLSGDNLNSAGSKGSQTPGSPREPPRRLADVWGFRRKVGASSSMSSSTTPGTAGISSNNESGESEKEAKKHKGKKQLSKAS